MDWQPDAAAADGYICPPCPVFHPTAAEFQDPLKYITSIRHIGMQAGICKIVPPAGWRPPFAINEKAFRFRTRVQQLNCIDALSRAEGNFVDALRMFLYRRGAPMKALPRVDGQLVNLLLLYKTVTELGGYHVVCAEQLWEQVVRRVGRTRGADCPSEKLCCAYQSHYESLLLAYEQEEATKRTDRPSDKTHHVKVKEEAPTPDSASSSSSSSTKARGVSATPTAKLRSSMKQIKPEVTDAAQVSTGRVKRTLFTEGGSTSGSDENDNSFSTGDKIRKSGDCAQTIEPAALRPSPKRTFRLDPPEIRAGQQFYQFFPDSGAVVAEVRRVLGGKKPHALVRYVADGSTDDIELSTLQILVANGWSPDAAELAFKSEICQTCLRGDCWDKMLLCDSCNGGHHLFCLDTPLDCVPEGDWYCDACVQEATEAARDGTPSFGFEMGAETSLIDYKEKADAWKMKHFGFASMPELEAAQVTDADLEREYWRILGTPAHEQRLEVEYGSDVDSGAVGSGFPRLDSYLKGLRFVEKRFRNLTAPGKSDHVRNLNQFFSHGLREGLESGRSLEDLLASYAHDGWNLNNLPKLPGSVLQHLDEDIKGVMVPWIYMGMCFSTFCWHVEDHNFYSISYLHCGAPKTWYGVPCDKAELFEATMKKLSPELFGNQPDLHLQMVTMFSPATLRQHGVPVYRATHRPNEFMVTFPSAYHGGFNNGFNCAEAVNFSTVDWLPWGRKSVANYRQFQKLPVFSHDALVCSLAETLADEHNTSVDYDSAKAFVVPAMEQLQEEFVEFERRVAASAIQRRGEMSEYEQHLHGSGDGGVSSSRRSMSSRGNTKMCDAGDEGGMKRRQLSTAPSKMKMTTTVSARPSRMVLWAGRSGKHEGLRCVTCKQYCYLQAVVCTKCRHHSSVGCADHFATMCKCDPEQYYVYLYRHTPVELATLLDRMKARLQCVEDWNAEFDACFGRGTKPTVRVLKNLLAKGKTMGGARIERLDALSRAVQSATAWSMQAEGLLDVHRVRQRRDESGKTSWQQVLVLLQDADELVAVPAALEHIQQLADAWETCRLDAEELLDRVSGVQHDEAEGVSVFSLGGNARATVSSLDDANRMIQRLLAAIGDVRVRVLEVGVDAGKGAIDQFDRASAYLEVLAGANATVAVVATGAAVGETECRALVDDADALRLDRHLIIRKIELVRAMLRSIEAVSVEMTMALNDHSKSTEELAVLLDRARRLPILPASAAELSDRVGKCRAWEHRAKELLDGEGGGGKPLLADVEEFADSADAHSVPTSSLVRRQLFGRVQDAKRWASTVSALFLRPSASRLGLDKFLDDALTRLQESEAWVLSAGEQGARAGRPQLVCVCDQVMNERAELITCRRCERFFHPTCVGVATKAQQHAFNCADCRQARGYGHDRRLEPPQPQSDRFCSCRGEEYSPMICCDFCDEWYHGVCVGLNEIEMTRVEAYRCPRCAVRQHVHYLDKQLVRRECSGRRPTLARVDSFLSQLETQLVAEPPGAQALTTYVAAVRGVERRARAYIDEFAANFSPTTFDAVDAENKARQVVGLLELVAGLEVALEDVQGSLGAIHWCLRACGLVLGDGPAPRYAHLVVLLEDANGQPGFEFPRPEYANIRQTIADRVANASRWLRHVKALEVEDWNVGKAKRLQAEYEELVRFLELPAAEVKLVHDLARGLGNRSLESDEEKESDEYQAAKRPRIE